MICGFAACYNCTYFYGCVIKKMKEKLIRLCRKYKHAYMLLIGMGVYSWFFLLEKLNLPPVIWVHVSLDDKIPFVEEYVIPYVLWYLYMILPMIYYGFRDSKEFIRLGTFMFGGMAVACLIYTIAPNGQQLRPLVLNNDIFSKIVGWLYANDTPTNSAPSIHVINAIAVHSSIWHYPKFGKMMKSMSLLLCVLICMSTVFVKQHSVVCVIAALVLCAVLYVVLYREDLSVAWRKRFSVTKSDA